MSNDKVAIPERWTGEYKKWADTLQYEGALICRVIRELGEAEAERDALEAENRRLKAPVTDEEWGAAFDRGRREHSLNLLERFEVDALIAARADAKEKA